MKLELYLLKNKKDDVKNNVRRFQSINFISYKQRYLNNFTTHLSPLCENLWNNKVLQLVTECCGMMTKKIQGLQIIFN